MAPVGFLARTDGKPFQIDHYRQHEHDMAPGLIHLVCIKLRGKSLLFSGLSMASSTTPFRIILPMWLCLLRSLPEIATPC